MASSNTNPFENLSADTKTNYTNEECTSGRNQSPSQTEDGREAQTDCVQKRSNTVVENTAPQPSVSAVPRECSVGSSSMCRICQLNREESAEILETSRCSCKGSLARVHRNCLERWVQYRGSNICEICGTRFNNVTNPPLPSSVIESLMTSPTPPDTFYFQTLETIRLQLLQVQTINRRKRTAIAGFLVFLFLVTGVTAVLTVGADQDFQKANNNPWASETQIRKAHIVFSICLSFLFFCITLTVGLSLMWVIVEVYFYIRRRQIFRDAAERLVNNRGQL